MARAPALPFQSIRAIAFDFDGVILDSVQLKADLFIEAYDGELNAVQKEQILAYQALHGGVGRVKKFEYFERAIFGQTPEPTVVAGLAARYGELLMQRIGDCEELPGARAFLTRFHRRLALHLVSGTSHDDLVRIVADRSLAPYLDSVTGAPTGKVEAFSTIAANGGWSPQQVLAIGDSSTEYVAARELGMPFIGIVKEGDANPFPHDLPTYANLQQLDKAWH